MFKQNPILGHGPKTFRKFCSEPENYVYDFACTTHPIQYTYAIIG